MWKLGMDRSGVRVSACRPFAGFATRFTPPVRRVFPADLDAVKRGSRVHFHPGALTALKVRLRGRPGSANPVSVLRPRLGLGQHTDFGASAPDSLLQGLALDVRSHRHVSVLMSLSASADLTCPFLCLVGLLSSILQCDDRREALFLRALRLSRCGAGDQPHFYHAIDELAALPAEFPALAPMPADLPPLLALIFDADNTLFYAVPRRTHVLPLLPPPADAARPRTRADDDGALPAPAQTPDLAIVPEGFDADAAVDDARDIGEVIEAGDAQTVVAIASRLLAFEPDAQDLLALRAHALERLGKTPDALIDVEHAIKTGDAPALGAFRKHLRAQLGYAPGE
jgi:hypothetical protein